MKSKDRQLLEEAYDQVIILELFDNPYSDIEPGEAAEFETGQGFEFTFYTDSNKEVTVYFILTSSSSIEVGFTVDGTDAATGEGGEETYRILATVMKIITQVMSNPIGFYDENKDKYVNITNKIDTFVWGARIHEEGRVKLYDRGAKRLEGLLNDLSSKKGTLKQGDKWTHVPGEDYTKEGIKYYHLLKNPAALQKLHQGKQEQEQQNQAKDAGKLKTLFLDGDFRNKHAGRHSPEIFAKLPDKFKMEALLDSNLSFIPPGIFETLTPQMQTAVLQNKELLVKVNDTVPLNSADKSTLKESLTNYLNDAFKRKKSLYLERLYQSNYKPRKDNLLVQQLSNEIVSQILQTTKLPKDFEYLRLDVFKKAASKKI